jgi:hypothetical protein
LTKLEQFGTDVVPYALLVYSIRSPYTKESYFRRLRRFFDAIGHEGTTFELGCNFFARKGRKEPIRAFVSRDSFSPENRDWKLLVTY